MSTKSKIIYGKTLCESSLPNVSSGDILLSGTHASKSASFYLNDSILSKHLLLIGGTGSGKTNTFNLVLKQLKSKMTNNDVMIIFDTKGDFYNEFYCRDKDLVIGNSNQYDESSEKWNLFKEILADGNAPKKIKENIMEIANTIFSDRLKNSSQPFFPNAAKEIFSGLLMSIIEDGFKFGKDQKQKTFYNSSLCEFFSSWSIDDYVENFSYRPDLRYLTSYLGNSNSEQGLGVMAEMLSVVNQLFIGKFAEQGMFSVRDFIKNKGGKTLFIEYDLSIGSTLSPLYQLLIDLSLKEAMSRSKKSGNVYLIFDEFKLLPNLKHIENAVNFGRSLGVRVIAGLQSIEQLYDSYGEHTAKNIIGGFSSFFIFRANDFQTKQYFINLFGKNMLLDQYTGFANNIISEKREGNVIEDWDLNSLSVGEAIVGLESYDPFVFKFDLYRGKQ